MTDLEKEIAALYWDSDIPVAEIMDTYGLPLHEVLRLAGPASLDGVDCRYCSGPVFVYSRSQARDRHEKIAKGYRVLDWAMPDACETCSNKRKAEYQRKLSAGYEAKQERRKLLGTMPYRDYLQTPEWQETRKAALRRARYCCQACSSTFRLNVHHRTYARRGQELNSDLIVLCAGCHQLFHDNAKLAEGGRAKT